MTDATTRAIEQLYAVAPGAFTRERNARAAALAKAGHAAEAKAIRELRRPPAPLWAANQLAHAEPERLAAFLEGVERVRRTQLSDPRAAAGALQRERAELEALVGRAGELLEGQGQRLTVETRRRISSALLGAAADRRLADDLRHGRLTVEPPPPGFEVLAASGRPDLRLVAGGKSRQASREAEAAQRVQAEREQERQRREAEAARRAAAEREAATRLADAERLAREVADARGRLRDARRAARAAEAAARKARRSPRG
jgi:hypothetical protein